MLTAAGLRLQRLARSGCDPLARGRHLRRLGLVRLLEGCRERRGLVGDLPADRHRARRVRGHIQRGSRRVHAPRRRADDQPGGAGFRRRRRRSAPRDDHQPRRPDCAKSKSPPMPNWFWRRRPQTWRIRRSRNCSSRPSISPGLGAILATRRRRAPTSRRSGPRTLAVVDGEAVGQARIRDRPRAVPWPRRQHSRTGRSDRRPAALRRNRAPCSIRSLPCAAACALRRARRRASTSGRWSPRHARSCSI